MSAAMPGAHGVQNSPSTFFRNAIGRPVVVRLTTGSDFHGVLAMVDGFMNISLEQTEEYVDGKLKARYGDSFIRGNNGESKYRKAKHSSGRRRFGG